MKIRGQRECKACGNRWSYYDTGSISCPACGRLNSVGTDEDRSLHTATAATLDLTPVRTRVESEPLRRLAERASDRSRAFTRGYGFIDGGTLRDLDDTYLAAMELRSVAGELTRRMDTDDEEELYFTVLLRADEGERPSVDEVPRSMRALRGLAYANAVKEYRSDLRTYLKEHPDPAVDDTIERYRATSNGSVRFRGTSPPKSPNAWSPQRGRSAAISLRVTRVHSSEPRSDSTH